MTQLFFIGRAPGPLSPPTIAQCIPRRLMAPRSSRRRFDREESGLSWCLAEVIDAGKTIAFILNADSPPDMWSTCCKAELSVQQFAHPFCPFCQYLIGMPVRYVHDTSYRDDVVIWDGLLKQVTHGVHKDHFGLRPSERIIELFWHETNIKSLFVGVTGNATKAFRKSLSIAVFTTGADFQTPSNGIPRGIGPLNLRFSTHSRSVVRKTCPR